jgi:hypothetical protein
MLSSKERSTNNLYRMQRIFVRQEDAERGA